MINPKSMQNLKPFRKGNKASKGRPKGAKSLTTRLREAMDKPRTIKIDGKPRTRETADWIVDRMTLKAINGDNAMIKEILDRLEGKPLQTIESQERIELDFSALTDEQLDRIIEKGNLE